VVSGVALLVGGVLLLAQVDTVLGRNPVENDIVTELPSDEGERVIPELPESNGYTLRRQATAYQIELFELLVNAHDQFYETASDEDLKNYASAIVRNFVADFFTLSNKNSRSDVGGLQFFSEDVVDNFRNVAVDEFYLYLNRYIETFGSESLPTVSSTIILGEVEFDYLMIEVEGESNEISDEREGTRLKEEVRTIIIDIEWTYEATTLPYIDRFQTLARFVLVEHEESVRIYVIELTETDEDYHESYS
jgi:hypothetical protein